MIELDIYVVDVPTKNRALIATCVADSLSSEDVTRAAKERIMKPFRRMTGLMHTSPILLEERSTTLKFGVVWKDHDDKYAQYDLYEVEVIGTHESDAAITDAIDLPYRPNSMIGSLLDMMQPSFREQRASKRVRAIMRGDD